MATVFDVFSQIPYTFLTISQSRVRGDAVASERELNGIFKDKSGKVQNGQMESVDSTATLHVHPEDFEYTRAEQFVGQGVNVNGQDYSIIGATAGTNFDNGQIEHYRLTLQIAKYVRGENV